MAVQVPRLPWLGRGAAPLRPPWHTGPVGLPAGVFRVCRRSPAGTAAPCGRSRSAAAALAAAVGARQFARRTWQTADSRDGEEPEAFGGLHLHGAAAEWLAEQQRACRGQFHPTPIQAEGMLPILKGQSVTLMAPTGSGKTLAYLLPLWERRARGAPPAVPQVLIIVPSEDLKQQIGGVARALARGSEDAVLVLNKAADILEDRVVPPWALVATPQLLLEMNEMESCAAFWEQTVTGLQTIVVDEVDCMVSATGGRNSDLNWVLKAAVSARMTGRRRGAGKPLQVVLASASIDEVTLDILTMLTRSKLVSIQAGAVPVEPLPELLQGEGDETVRDMLSLARDQANDFAITFWPPGLTHMVLPVEALWSGTSLSKEALQQIPQVVYTLSVQRCLVVLAEGRKPMQKAASLGKYLRFLRRELAPFGFQVATVSAAVTESEVVGGGGLRAAQVVLGRGEVLRGLDIPGVEAVIVIGEHSSAREYLHIAGRTARWEQSRGAPTGGAVVSIVGRQTVQRMKLWGKKMDFELENFRLKPMPKP